MGYRSAVSYRYDTAFELRKKKTLNSPGSEGIEVHEPTSSTALEQKTRGTKRLMIFFMHIV